MWPTAEPGRTSAALVALLALAGFLGAAARGASLPVAPLSQAGKLVAAPSPGRLGPEGVPVPDVRYVLAQPQKVKLGETIDGITCERTETVVYHVHAHLTIFVGRRALAIPYGVGIGPPYTGVNTSVGPFVTGGSCFMWLHTHALDGVIHIESPSPRIYSLGQFFAVWGLKLSARQVGPAKGKVTAFYDGKLWTASAASIPLTGGTQIQLDVGTPRVAPEHIVFPPGLGPPLKRQAKK